VFNVFNLPDDPPPSEFQRGKPIETELTALTASPAGDGRLPPLGRPPADEVELRRLMDYLGDPVSFAEWFQRLMEQTDPAELNEEHPLR
jgi:hypothetical protein